jgi:hypothetical protein
MERNDLKTRTRSRGGICHGVMQSDPDCAFTEWLSYGAEQFNSVNK